jgi:hypothetical protein
MAAGNRRETGFHVLAGMIATEKRYLLIGTITDMPHRKLEARDRKPEFNGLFEIFKCIRHHASGRAQKSKKIQLLDVMLMNVTGKIVMNMIVY